MTSLKQETEAPSLAGYRLDRKRKEYLAIGSSSETPMHLDAADAGDKEIRNQKLKLTIVTAVSVVTMLLSLWFFKQDFSISAVAWLTLAAFVPLTIVVLTLVKLDRLSQMPAAAQVAALAWGGGVSIILAGFVNALLMEDVLRYTGSGDVSTNITARLVAPMSEELFKGLGVLIILLIIRSRLTSILSVTVLGGLVGGGFAYIENIQYFLSAHASGSAVLGITMVARGIFSLFIHPMATSLTALGLGVVLVRRLPWYCAIPIAITGFCGAVALHALWNLGATTGLTFIAFYLLVDIPLFLLWIISLIVASHKLLAKTELGFIPYLRVGLITPQESALVVHKSAWKSALVFTRQRDRSNVKTLRKLRQLLATLALLQLSNQRQHGWLREQVIESQRCYEQIVQTRRKLASLSESSTNEG